MPLLQLIRTLTWFGVGAYCLYSVARNRGYVQELRDTPGNLKIKRLLTVLTSLGVLFLLGAIGEFVEFLRAGGNGSLGHAHGRGSVWSGLVLIGMGLFTRIFYYGLTSGRKLFFNKLNPEKAHPLPVWADRLIYTLFALLFFYCGVQDLVYALR
jgi:hypothetical protein